MTIKDFFFHGTNKDKNKDNKGAGARTQKKSIKPTAAEFKKLGKNPSPQAVMKLFSRSYRILNDVELQNADYPPMLFAQLDDGAATPDELPGAVGEFGRCADNPIPVNGPTGQVTYLSRLLTDDTGSRMAFHRLGSTRSSVLDAMVDIFELVSVDCTRYDRLYLDMYHLGQSQKAPAGYHLMDELTGITGTSIGLSRDFPLHIEQDAFEYACSVFGAPVVSAVLEDMDLEAAQALVKTMEREQTERS